VRQWWARWVQLWRGEEAPWSLALVRILLGAVILWDFLEIAQLELVIALFGTQDAGGLSDALTRLNPPLWTRMFGASEASARALHALITFSAAAFCAGLFTRAAAVTLLIAWAQFAELVPAADRGIDTLCRDVLLIFVFADGGAGLSLDAALRTRSFVGDGRAVPVWPRKLLVLQIVAMYFLAGIQKVGVHWWPPGHYAALYFILQDPAIARFDFTWLRKTPFFQLTQLSSAVTILFQDTYPMVLVLRWARSDPTRWRARLAPWAWLEWGWIGIGAVFHLLLAVTCELGIFPWAMLALYPAWVAPEKWPDWARRLTSARG
jgi:Vitamin K-dependent gamma-carboxylase